MARITRFKLLDMLKAFMDDRDNVLETHWPDGESKREMCNFSVELQDGRVFIVSVDEF